MKALSTDSSSLCSPFFSRRSGEERFRVVCLPYAGGSESVYAQWPDYFASDVAVMAVRLPGRGVRYAEAPYTSIEPLIKDLTYAAASLLDKPFAIFGHSLGALVAFEFARALSMRYGKSPTQLFVAGCCAPHLALPANSRLPLACHKLSNDRLAELLRRFDGVPPEVWDSPELLEICMTLMRADLQVHDSYRRPRPPGERQVTCSITAFGGNDDVPDVPAEAIDEWHRCTLGEFRAYQLPGGHFFPRQHTAFIAAEIAKSFRGH